MFQEIESVRNPAEQRERLEALFDRLADAGGYHITDVMRAEDKLRVMALEVIQGIEPGPNGVPVKTSFGREERFRLGTLDGEPLGKIKIGQRARSIGTKKLQEMEMRGQSADVFRDFPADFEAEGGLAFLLLYLYGWGFPTQRYRRRHGEGRGEKDSYGRPVARIDQWRLVEVGSVYAREAVDELCERAAGKPDAEARAMLERGLQLSPGHEKATAALEALGSPRRSSRKGAA